MKIAVHQMQSGIDPVRNTNIMAIAIAEAAADGAAFYFAPEMSILLDRNRQRAAQHIVALEYNPHVGRLAAQAQRCTIGVHIGSVAVATADGRWANRSVVIDPSGAIAATYDKMHLFDVDLSSGESWRESSAYRAGDAPRIVQTPLGRMGLSICYDMRFPELFATMTKAGVDILAVPSAFTIPTGRAHWHTLLKARAIESASFVVAAAQSGHHEDGRDTFGHSLVVDPWGDVLLDMGEGEGLGFVDLDLARVDEVRAQIPVHLNRRDVPSPA